MYARGFALGVFVPFSLLSFLIRRIKRTRDCFLFRRANEDIGTESKALGVHVQLGPVGGPLGKIPVVCIPLLAGLVVGVSGR